MRYAVGGLSSQIGSCAAAAAPRGTQSPCVPRAGAPCPPPPPPPGGARHLEEETEVPRLALFQLKAEAGSTSYASRYRPCMGSTEIRPGHRGYPRVDLRRRRQCQFCRCRCRCARSGHPRLSVSSRVLAFIDRQTWSRWQHYRLLLLCVLQILLELQVLLFAALWG
jgi:hypothetical protein